MREYILTEKERIVLKCYSEKGIKSNHFYVLVHRLRKNYNSLKTDMHLVEMVLRQEGII